MLAYARCAILIATKDVKRQGFICLHMPAYLINVKRRKKTSLAYADICLQPNHESAPSPLLSCSWHYARNMLAYASLLLRALPMF